MYLDCNHCMRANSETTRRGMGCGFLDPGQHKNLPVAHELDGVLQDPDDVCAGWYLSLPAVNETIVAFTWWEKSQLTQWVGGEAPAALMEAVTVFSGACGEVEGFVNRRSREAMSNGSR